MAQRRFERVPTVARSAIHHVVALDRPTVACTIYNGALEPKRPRIARLGVALFNDVILRTAMHLGLDIVELRDRLHRASGLRQPDRTICSRSVANCARNQTRCRSHK